MVRVILGLGFIAAAVASAVAIQRAPRAPQEQAMSFDKPSEAELRTQLTPQQFEVTQQQGTEPPFSNAFWDNKEDGIYVDVVSGEPLFSSLDKYDSGTGWPSFTRPLEDNVTMHRDGGLGMARTEVRSKAAGSHLGHVFDDGPGPGGQRFCMNSAALRFVPLGALRGAGLGRYLFRFADKQHWDIATLAGGCFWGMEELFEKQPGVLETQVGYTGGLTDHATYRTVSGGDTGHAEALQVLFDPRKTSYEALLLYFFRMHDPTTRDRQVNDVGSQYRSAIFTRGDKQRAVAQAVKERVARSGKWPAPVVTEIAPLGKFFRAEPEHQGYLDAHPGGYTCHTVRAFTF